MFQIPHARSIVAMLLLVGAAVRALPAQAAASAVSVSLGRHVLTGQAAVGDGLSAELVAADGSLKATAAEMTIGEGGDFRLELVDSVSQPVPVLSGDRLRLLTSGSAAREARVPALTADGDVALDRVTGTAPPGAEVTVTVERFVATPAIDVVTADGAGHYVADFSGRFDIVRGTTVRASVKEGIVTFELEWPMSEVVQIEYESDVVHGQGPAGAAVRADLRRAANPRPIATARAAVGQISRSFDLVLRDAAGEPVPVLAGDWLHVSYLGLAERDFEVPVLTAVAEPATERVAGQAPPGATVDVVVDKGLTEEAASTTAGADGRYEVSFAGRSDIVAGSIGVVTAQPSDNLELSRGWAAAKLTVALGRDAVSGVVAPGLPVRVELHGSDGSLRAGDTAIVAASGLRGRRGTFTASLHGSQGEPVAILPGDQLQVRRADEAIELVIPLLTADIDVAADRVTGQAPPGWKLSVTVEYQLGSRSLDTTTGLDGRYAAEFAGIADIQTGRAVQVVLTTADGHVIELDTAAPSMLLWPELARLEGTAATGAPVAVSVRDADGRERATGNTTADVVGSYVAQLTDAAITPYYAQPGDRVRVTAGAAEVEMTVPPLTLDWDLATDRIFGSVIRGGTVTAVARPPGGEGDEAIELSAQLLFTSDYDLNFAGRVDLRPGSRLQLVYRGSDANGIGLVRTVPIVNIQAGGDTVFGFALPHGSVEIVVWADQFVTSVTTKTGADQRFAVQLVDDENAPVIISSGQNVQVRFGDEVIDMPVEQLTTSLDPIGRTIRGTAPPSRTLEVRLIPPAGQQWRTSLVSDSGGDYSLDLPDEAVPSAGNLLETGYRVGDGHRVFARSAVPQLVAYLGGARVEGLALPLAAVRLQLDGADGTGLGQAQIDSDTFGRYSAELGGSRPVHIAAGDRLRAIVGDETVAMTLPAVTATLNRDDGRVRGRVPRGGGRRTIQLRVFLADETQPLGLEVPADTRGWFEYDPAGREGYPPRYDAAAVERIEAVFTLPDGNQAIASAWRSVWLYVPFIRMVGAP